MKPIVAAAAAVAGDRPLHVLEVGSWAGASCVSWARAIESLPHGGRVTCVDLWRPYFDLGANRDAVYADMTDAADQGDIFPLFLHNIRAAGVAHIVDHHVGASEDVLPRLEPASFDVIFLDGSHAVDDVSSDLLQALRLIRVGGIVCGDDLELQRDDIHPSEHRAGLASRQDFFWAASANSYYHPGVTEAVARLIGPVHVWNGFWAVRRGQSGWEWLEFEPGELPAHIAAALDEESAEGAKGEGRRTEQASQPELVGETDGYNVIRLGPRFIAAAKTLGTLSFGAIGDRDLAPVILVGDSVEDVRSRALSHEPPHQEIELVDQTVTYNFVKFGPRYVALDRRIGDLSLGTERIGDRELPPYVLIDATLEQLRARVVEVEDQAPKPPELVGETASYNLVRLGAHYVALARLLGDVTIGVETLGERELPPHVLIEDTLERLQIRVAKIEDESAPIALELVGETDAYNLIRLGPRYVAAAKSLGPVSLGAEIIGSRELAPVILVGDSLEELKSRAAANEPHVELVEETSDYNLVRFDSRYVALARSLGQILVGIEKVGERDLPPYILLSPTLEELRGRVADAVPRGDVAERESNQR
jgi:predicted O-methyltransferase YrrM